MGNFNSPAEPGLAQALTEPLHRPEIALDRSIAVLATFGQYRLISDHNGGPHQN
jgi:hypothetical protein